MGAPDGADASRDGSTNGDTAPSSCFGTRKCDGDSIRACDGGKVGAVLATCTPDTCSLGRCTSAACAAAESDRTGLAGCLFYAFEADNVTSDALLPTSFLVTNPGASATQVSLQDPVPAVGGGTTWVDATSSPMTVAPGASLRLSIAGQQVVGAGAFPRAAVRITSTSPVTAVVIHSDDGDQSLTYSSGGTMLLPAQTLGSHYRAMTYPQVATTAVAASSGSLGGAGRIAIVGTQPATNVRLTLPPNTTAVTSASAALLTGGEEFDAVLDDGEVLQLYSAAEQSDLSGTEISADLQVAVFSGNMTTTYGLESTGVNSPDMAHEQMPPVGAWSRRWVAAALPPQAGTCDSLLGMPGASLWRILATEAGGTLVTFDAPPGVVGLPASITLGAGATSQLIVSGGSFTIAATSAVLVTQGIDCEPSLSLAVSLDHLLTDLPFAVLPNFDQVIAVVRPAGTPIELDGAVIGDDSFFPAGTGYEVAQIQISSCPPSQGVCTHRLTGKFGMTLRGMDVLSSYALTAPTFAGCVDLTDPTCLQ